MQHSVCSDFLEHLSRLDDEQSFEEFRRSVKRSLEETAAEEDESDNGEPRSPVSTTKPSSSYEAEESDGEEDSIDQGHISLLKHLPPVGGPGGAPPTPATIQVSPSVAPVTPGTYFAARSSKLGTLSGSHDRPDFGFYFGQSPYGGGERQQQQQQPEQPSPIIRQPNVSDFVEPSPQLPSPMEGAGLVITPFAIDFGARCSVGWRYSASVTLYNAGKSTVVAMAEFVGEDAAMFGIEEPARWRLVPLQTAVVNVVFHPTMAGPRWAALVVYATPAADPRSIRPESLVSLAVVQPTNRKTVMARGSSCAPRITFHAIDGGDVPSVLPLISVTAPAGASSQAWAARLVIQNSSPDTREAIQITPVNDAVSVEPGSTVLESSSAVQVLVASSVPFHSSELLVVCHSGGHAVIPLTCAMRGPPPPPALQLPEGLECIEMEWTGKRAVSRVMIRNGDDDSSLGVSLAARPKAYFSVNPELSTIPARSVLRAIVMFSVPPYRARDGRKEIRGQLTISATTTTTPEAAVVCETISLIGKVK
jgi:hypothetical protein